MHLLAALVNLLAASLALVAAPVVAVVRRCRRPRQRHATGPRRRQDP